MALRVLHLILLTILGLLLLLSRSQSAKGVEPLALRYENVVPRSRLGAPARLSRPGHAVLPPCGCRLLRPSWSDRMCVLVENAAGSGSVRCWTHHQASLSGISG